MLKTYTMIKWNSVDDHEFSQIVLVRHIITMPSNHIKAGMILNYKVDININKQLVNKELKTYLNCTKVFALILVHNLKSDIISLFKPCSRSFEMPRVCKTIGPNWTQIRKLKMSPINFKWNRIIGLKRSNARTFASTFSPFFVFFISILQVRDVWACIQNSKAR